MSGNGFKDPSQPYPNSTFARAEEGSSDEEGRESDDEPMLPIEKKAAKLDRKRCVGLHAVQIAVVWCPRRLQLCTSSSPRLLAPESVTALQAARC